MRARQDFSLSLSLSLFLCPFLSNGVSRRTSFVYIYIYIRNLRHEELAAAVGKIVRRVPATRSISTSDSSTRGNGSLVVGFRDGKRRDLPPAIETVSFQCHETILFAGDPARFVSTTFYFREFNVTRGQEEGRTRSEQEARRETKWGVGRARLVDWLFVESAVKPEQRNGQSVKVTNEITCSIFRRKSTFRGLVPQGIARDVFQPTSRLLRRRFPQNGKLKNVEM